MKKKIVYINVVCNGSTGKIMCDLAKTAEDAGYLTYCFYGRGNGKKGINAIKIGNKFSFLFHAILARIGFNGHGSYFATKKLIKRLKSINPDIIHLHNIHGYYLNLKVLFKYLKNEYHGKIIWTLHDCWAFTGHCAYFTLVNCSKWQTKCYKCPQLKAYPKTLFDTTKKEYKQKKKLFTGLSNLTIVTPSMWLQKLVEKSMLNEYLVKTINNGIDLNIFKQTIDNSIYDKYNIPKNKKIILGIANIWEERKGIKDIYELSKVLPADYQIVIIGKLITNDKLNNIIYIERTDNQLELVKLYSIAYALFVPTYEDNYPTVILESIACKTPVLSYNTGGCSEAINGCGKTFLPQKYDEIVEKLNNLEVYDYKKIRQKISKEEMCKEYLKLYK